MSIPVKTKLSYPVSLSEAKRHLRIEEDWHDDDDYISSLIIAGTQKAENYIGKDIAETNNTQIIYNFVSDTITIMEGNFLEFTQGVTDASTLISTDYVDIGYNFVNVVLPSCINSDPLTITYKTGYEETDCPALVKQAILVKIADLYDIDRQSYTEGNIKQNKAFESLLDSYRQIIL